MCVLAQFFFNNTKKHTTCISSAVSCTSVAGVLDGKDNGSSSCSAVDAVRIGGGFGAARKQSAFYVQEDKNETQA